MNYCPHCGAPEPPGARFCPSCGRRYDANGSSFSFNNALNWRPLESAVELCVRWLDPVCRAVEIWIRRAIDAILKENPAAPSYVVWNLLAVFFCSVPCGAIGLIYSVRTLQLKKNGDDSPVAASKNAKLWFALSIVWLFAFRLHLYHI